MVDTVLYTHTSHATGTPKNTPSNTIQTCSDNYHTNGHIPRKIPEPFGEWQPQLKEIFHFIHTYTRSHPTTRSIILLPFISRRYIAMVSLNSRPKTSPQHSPAIILYLWESWEAQEVSRREYLPGWVAEWVQAVCLCVCTSMCRCLELNCQWRPFLIVAPKNSVAISARPRFSGLIR